jgi:hypothetical protein
MAILEKMMEIKEVFSSQIEHVLLPFLIPHDKILIVEGPDADVSGFGFALTCFSATYSVTCSLRGLEDVLIQARASESLNLFLGALLRRQNESNGHELLLGLPRAILKEELAQHHVQNSQDNIMFSWQFCNQENKVVCQCYVYLKIHSEAEFFGLNFALQPESTDGDLDFL